MPTPSKRPLNSLWQPYGDDHAMDTKTDDGIPWLMVPVNSAADFVLRQSWRYDICNADPDMVSVQKLGFRRYWALGKKTGPPTFLSAVDSSGAHQAFLWVSVKRLLSFRIAFYFLSDSDPATKKAIHRAVKRENSATLNELVQEVNEILQPQANVVFEIAAGHKEDVTLAGDCGDRVQDNAFSKFYHEMLNPAAHFHVFFVWAYAGAEYYAETVLIDNDRGLCLFADDVPHELQAHVLAHEAVHYLLFRRSYMGDHHSKLLDNLMYARTGAYKMEATERLGRFYADIINPDRYKKL
jgi:hypothetical protein